MKCVIIRLWLFALSAAWSHGALPGVWIHLPPPSEARDPMAWPARLILREDGGGIIEALISGVRRQVYTIRGGKEVGAATILASGEVSGRAVQFQEESGVLTLVDHSQPKSIAFTHMPEWSARFDSALPGPTGKDDAVAILSRIVGLEVKKMKREELFSTYALGYSNLIYAAFGLKERNSLLSKQLVAKSGDVGFDLFVAYWESEQR